MKTVLPTVRDTVRAQLWPTPVFAVVLAVAAGLLLPGLDLRIDDSLPEWLSSLTFSLTVVTLQLASSQFSPRLLRTFASDAFVQSTLGLFLATFTYSLTVLRSVRSSAEGTSAFVPRISVTISFLLAIASVVSLVLFLAHLARQLRVETMLRDVHQNTTATLRAVLRPLDDRPGFTPSIPERPGNALTITAPVSGFVLRIDKDDLLAAAQTADALVVIQAQPGNSVIEGNPIGWIRPSDGLMDDSTVDVLRGRIARAIHVGYERTAAQDVAYGLRQLTDVANKALSPGINDPTTAVHALGHISAILCDLADRDLGPVILTDDDGQVRVVLHRPDLAALVDVAITQPRRYGAADPFVMARLMALLRELAWRARPDQQHVVLGQLARIRTTVGAQDFDQTEIAQLRVAGEQVEDTLRRRLEREPGQS